MMIESYYGDINISPFCLKESFAILPRRDIFTGEWIWWKQVLVIVRDLGVDTIDFTGRPDTEYFYTKVENFTWFSLKYG